MTPSGIICVHDDLHFGIINLHAQKSNVVLVEISDSKNESLRTRAGMRCHERRGHFDRLYHRRNVVMQK